MRGEDTHDTRSHRLPGAQICIGSSRNCSVFPGMLYHGKLREGSDSLSMKPVGCIPWCSTDVQLLQEGVLYLIRTIDTLLVMCQIQGPGIILWQQ